MIKKVARNEMRVERHKRVRNKLSGTSEVPRLCVFRSNKNISVQIIDDQKSITLVSTSTLDKDVNLKNKSNIEVAKEIGKKIAEKAKANNINKVVFDRGGYLYHGRVKALADSAREAGLEF